MSAWEFARLSLGPQPVTAALSLFSIVTASDLVGRAMLLDQVLLRTASSDNRFETPGVILLTNHLRPGLGLAILVDVDLVKNIEPGTRRPMREVAGLEQRLRNALPDAFWLEDVEVFGVREPELQLASGDTIVATLQGSAGCALSWKGGSGFATAGHVEPTKGNTVNHAGKKIGSVVWTNDPNKTGSVPKADFAVVELDPGATFTTTNARYQTGAALDPLTFTSTTGVLHTSATIIGYCLSWALPFYKATLGDSYITSKVISVRGDSGALVHLASGEMIGHIVGASPGVLSIVQDLDYQIQAASSALSGLSA